MSLAKVTAQIRNVKLHLFLANSGDYFCGLKPTEKTLGTWRPEEVTCKKCLKNYQEYKRLELD